MMMLAPCWMMLYAHEYAVLWCDSIFSVCHLVIRPGERMALPGPMQNVRMCSVSVLYFALFKGVLRYCLDSR